MLWNYIIIIIIIIVVVEFTGYGGFAVVNTIAVVEKIFLSYLKYNYILLNYYFFLNDNDYKNRIDKYNSQDEKFSISLFYQCCDNYFKTLIIMCFLNKYCNNNSSKYE